MKHDYDEVRWLTSHSEITQFILYIWTTNMGEKNMKTIVQILKTNKLSYK